MTGSDSDERRKNLRVPFHKPVEVIGLGMHRTSEISVAGLYLVTKEGFARDTQLTLQFKLEEDDDRAIQVRTRVLYIHEGVGVGLGFVDLSVADRARIMKFIEKR
jgi:PilZ domain